MRWRTVLAGLLVAVTLPVLSVGCDRVEGPPRESARQEGKADPGRTVAYSGPEKPDDSVWVLESLNGRDAMGDEDMLVLFAMKGEFGGEGGCTRFSIYHKLEGDHLRLVEPGFQTGSYNCGKPDSLKRQANDVLNIARDLARLEISDDRLELRSEAGDVAVFVRPPPAEVDPTLVGTEWFLVSLEGREPLPKPRLTLEIDRDSIGGFSGCNSFGGPVDRMVGGTLEWSENSTEGFSSTTVGCGGKNLEQQETRYQNAVGNVETYRVEGDRLEMTNGEGRTTLVFRQEAQWSSDPEELVGTSWRLRSTDGKEPAEGSVPTVRFESEKEVSWYDGCQNFEGRYFATENDLTVPVLGVSGGDCMKPEGYGESEKPCVVGCFGPEGDYRLRDGLMEIRTEAGETTSILEPLAGGEQPEQEGTPWVLRAFVEGGETTSVPGGAGITLAFDRGTLREEGTMFGSTGCNDYRVVYEHPIARNGPDRLVLAEPAVTKRKCAPRAAAEAEQRFLGILRDVGYYPSITADGKMSLDTGDGRKLVFSAPG